MKNVFRTGLVFLGLLMVAAPTTAQYGPAAPGGGGGNQPQPQPGGNLYVPDYIKPGYQMLYMSASSSESDEPSKVGPAGMGFTEYTVIAVLNDRVIVSGANYLAPNGVPLDAQGQIDHDTDPRVQFSGSVLQAFGALDIQTGQAFWMSIDEIKLLQPSDTIDVKNHPWPFKGQMVDAYTVGVKTDSGIELNIYRADNGEKLSNRSASGPMRRGDTGVNPFNRKHQSQMMLLDTRQMDNPLVNADWPNWAKRVKSMSYSGTYSITGQGIEPIPVGMSFDLEFKERGNDYVLGTLTTTVQGGQPSVAPVAHGPGTTLGYWIDPQVLNQLQQGRIDKNDILRTELTYQIQDGNLGRLGVFVVTNTAQTFYAVNGYNLRDGSLAYMSYHETTSGMTIEMQLQNIESE